MSNKLELQQLSIRVKDGDCKTLAEVKIVVEKYFKEEVIWSLLKDEYSKMNENTRIRFYAKLYADSFPRQHK